MSPALPPLTTIPGHDQRAFLAGAAAPSTSHRCWFSPPHGITKPTMKDRIASRSRIRRRNGTRAAAAAAAGVAVVVHCSSVGTACAETASSLGNDGHDGSADQDSIYRDRSQNLRGRMVSSSSLADGPASSPFEMDVLNFSSSRHPSLPQLPQGLDEQLELNLQDAAAAAAAASMPRPSMVSTGNNNEAHANRDLFGDDEDASNDYMNYLPPTPPMQARIVGGNPVTDNNKYPWSVALHRQGVHWCGGVLVAPQVIQTAGHCCMSNGNLGADEAILKTLNKHGDPDSLFRTIDPAKCRTHPNYVERGYLHDTCLCPIEGDPIDPKIIAPIEINRDPKFPADPTLDTSLDPNAVGMQVFKTMGYGSLNQQGKGTDWKMEVDVAYVNQDTCLRAFSGRYVKSDMLCAILPGQDACQGDSGGPLITTKQNNKPLLIGTVSWGFGCADPHYPGVYSRCSSYYGWLRDNICELSTSADSKLWPDSYLACEGKTDGNGASGKNAESTDATSAPTQAPTASSAPSTSTAPTLSDVGNKGGTNADRDDALQADNLPVFRSSVRLDFHFDNHPEDIGWSVKCGRGDSDVIDLADIPSGRYAQRDFAGETTAEMAYIPSDVLGECVVTVTDSWSDGLGEGSYILISHLLNDGHTQVIGKVEGDFTEERFTIAL